MSRSSYYDYIITDVLGSFSGITGRAMFGGYGIYQHGVFFALIADDQLYFKVDESNRTQYQELGSQPFVYYKGKQPMMMNYWLVPEEILGNLVELEQWVERAVKVAQQAKQSKQHKNA